MKLNRTLAQQNKCNYFLLQPRNKGGKPHPPHHDNRPLKLIFLSSSTHFTQYSFGLHHTPSAKFQLPFVCVPHQHRNIVPVCSLYQQQGMKISPEEVTGLLHKVLPDDAHVGEQDSWYGPYLPLPASSSSTFNPSAVGTGCTFGPHCHLTFGRRAPLLAHQHYQRMSKRLPPFGTGAMKPAATTSRRKVQAPSSHPPCC